jgi:hypothetical protein
MPTPEVRELLQTAYDGFNRREIDSVLATMHPEVQWPNGMEGGRVHGHAGVRDYWTRQWSMIDPHVDPVAFADEPDGRTAIAVHQTVRDLSGQILQDRLVEHVYRIEGSLILAMEIREPKPAE